MKRETAIRGRWKTTRAAALLTSLAWAMDAWAGEGPHPDPAASTVSSDTKEALLRGELATLELANGLESPKLVATLRSLAKLRRSEHDSDGAIDLYSRAASILEAAYGPDDLRLAKTLVDLGVVLQEAGRFAEAESTLRRALAAQERALAPDAGQQATTLGRLGTVLRDLDRWEEAEVVLVRGIQVREASEGPDHPDLAWNLNLLALLFKEEGRLGEAEPLARRALAIREATVPEGNPDRLLAMNNLASLLSSGTQMAEAEDLYRRVLEVRRRLLPANDPAVAQSLHNLGVLLDRQARYEEAREVLSEAGRIWQDTLGPNHDYVTSNLSILAGIDQALGSLPEAEAGFREVLARRELRYGGEHSRVAAAAADLASALQRMGRYAEAEPLYLRALEIDGRVSPPDEVGAASVSRNLGTLYHLTGRSTAAREAYERSLEVRERVLGSDHPDVASTLDVLGSLDLERDDLASAESRYERALEIRTQALGPDHPDVADTLGNLAGVHRAQGRTRIARREVERALEIRTAALGADHPSLSYNLVFLARYDQTHGRPRRALAHAERAYELFAATEDLPRRVATAALLAEIHNSQHHTGPAIFYGKLAVNTAQQLRANVTGLGDEAQTGLVDRYSDTYHDLAAGLSAEGRFAEAESVLRLLKEHEASSFVRGGVAVDTGGPAPLTETERDLAQELERLQVGLIADGEAYRALLDRRRKGEVLPADDAATEARLQTRLAEDREALRSWLDSVDAMSEGAKDEEDSGFVHLGLKELDQRKQTLAKLGNGSVLLTIFLVKERVHLLLTTPNAHVHREVRADRAEVYATVARLRTLLQDPESDPRQESEALYRWLLQPAEADLAAAHAQTLMVSLDGPLRYLPMAALWDGEHWLAERYAVVAYASTASGSLATAPREDVRVVGLGATHFEDEVMGRRFGPLAGVATELDGIVHESPSDPLGVVPGTVRLDAAFTKVALEEALLTGYPLVHLSTHFYLDPSGTDAASFLVLGDGSALSLTEVFRSELFSQALGEVDLLVLSACETGLGVGVTGSAVGDGREVESLGALLLQLGTKSVLATLWSVSDASTAAWMQRLYAQRASGLTKAEAVRTTQLAMIRGELTATESASQRGLEVIDVGPPAPINSWGHPYYWAPFVLTGNWL